MRLAVAVGVLLAAGAAIVVVGPSTERVTQQLAVRTGASQSVFAAIFLGASTSLPGIVVTAIAAYRGQLGLAVANALGGILAQAAFVGIADVVARRPLPAQAANRVVVGQTALLFLLIGLLPLALARPRAALGPVHPITPVLVLTYVAGMLLLRRAGRDLRGHATGGEQSAHDDARGRLWWRYALLVTVLFAAGVAVSFAVDPVARALGLSLVAAGAVLTAPVTSLPELVTAVAAARRGHPRVVMGDLVGSNTFDVLVVAVADLFARRPLFTALGSTAVLLVGGILVLHAVLLLGLVRRDEGTLGTRAAPESVIILVVYVVVSGVAVTT